MEGSNVLLNGMLEAVAAAGTVRLRVVLDLKLEEFQFVNGSGEHPHGPGAAASGSDDAEAAAISEYTAYGERLYELNPNAPVPRMGSVNAAVLTLLKQLPADFTRDQFEAVIPKAMRFDPVTGSFGVRTAFPSIRRAQQAYFSEFKKRGWVVPMQRPQRPNA
jgi:hypothetical protein